ncbi:MAG: hypothetical protein FJ023_02110 [Chloroflexi bacterium]|nr:hypothetical protein [Chloroflexota bacterium]
MAEHEVVHVAIAPPATLEEELVKKVAAIVAKNPYETRLRLTGKIPKIIASYDTMQMAESIARSLRELGLVAIVCTDSELRKSSQRYKAHTLKFEEQAVIFLDRSGQARRMESRESFLILNGRIQTYTETEVTKTVRKLNITATVLTGGIPIRRKVKEKTTTTSYQSDSFVRLYGRLSPEPFVEIPQHGFDYSFLGVEMVSSSTANFSTTIRKIRDALPQAIFDDRLVAPFGSDMHSTVPQENIDMNCKLIYWYHQAVSDLG